MEWFKFEAQSRTSPLRGPEKQNFEKIIVPKKRGVNGGSLCRKFVEKICRKSIENCGKFVENL